MDQLSIMAFFLKTAIRTLVIGMFWLYLSSTSFPSDDAAWIFFASFMLSSMLTWLGDKQNAAIERARDARVDHAARESELYIHTTSEEKRLISLVAAAKSFILFAFSLLIVDIFGIKILYAFVGSIAIIFIFEMLIPSDD